MLTADYHPIVAGVVPVADAASGIYDRSHCFNLSFSCHCLSGWLLSHLGIFMDKLPHIFIGSDALEAQLYQAKKQVGANLAMEHGAKRNLAVVPIDSRLDVAGNASPAYKLDGGISRLDQSFAG
jgi:hypothetical protein